MKSTNKFLIDSKVSVKTKLLVLWIALMLLYVYADIFSFYRTGYLDKVAAGFIGSLPANQFTLIASGLLMMIPVLVMILALFLKPGIVRWINIVGGSLYAAVGIGNLIGETWIYYLMYGAVEIAITVLIVVIALKWPKIT